MILPFLKPTWYQLSAWYARSLGIKRQIKSIHRRGGKDVTDFGMTLQDAIEQGGVHYYLFPTRAWAERVVIKEQFTYNGTTKPFWEWIVPKSLNPIYKEKDSCIILPKNDSRIQLGGTDDDAFVGLGGKSYTMSEFSRHKPEVTGFLAPILRQSDATFRANGTLMGKDNQLWKMLEANKNHPDWFSQWLRPHQTKCYCWVGSGYNINPELLSKIGKTSPNYGKIFNVQDDIDSGLVSLRLARQEFLNEPVVQAELGYYDTQYATAKGEGRTELNLPYDRNLPVFTFWDLGKGTADKSTDAMVIWFVQFPNDDLPKPKVWNFIGYHESVGKEWADYAQILNSQGYWYGGHYAPWDIAKGQAGHGSKTNLDYAKERGINFIPVQRGGSINNDIELCRRCWQYTYWSKEVNAPLERLAAYHQKANSAGVGTGVPEHDKSSNTADALRTLVRAWETGIIQNNSIRKPLLSDPTWGGRLSPTVETRPMLGGGGMDLRSKKQGGWRRI